MPQFEIIIFFNQVFWLAISLCASYLFFLKNFLVPSATILKTRAKKLTV